MASAERATPAASGPDSAAAATHASGRSNRPAALGTLHQRRTRSILTPPDTPFSNATMGTSAGALDVFVLTFNCGKAVVDVPTFARHLRGALVQRGQAARSGSSPDEGRLIDVGVDVGYDGQASAEGAPLPDLPDLVVFSLQEIAPLTYGYLGGQFLAPYFNSFKEALNIAAGELLEEQEPGQQLSASASASVSSRPSTTNSGRSTPRRQPLQRSKSTLSTIFRRQQAEFPYKLMEARNVGMTAIMLFARRPEAIARIEAAECAFGIANMGNKGAIALRVAYEEDSTNAGGQGGSGHVDGAADEEKKLAEVTFVATHLAAMEYNLRRRNANWASICSSCLFEDPHKILPEQFQSREAGARNIIEASTHSSSTKGDAKQTDGGEDIPPETEEEREALSARRLNDACMPSKYSDYLRQISIFKPGSHLFVAGDLNYRISTTTPPALATFPTMKTYLDFLERDQLTQEKNAHRTLHGLTEAPITFPPTYKIKHLSREKASDAVNKDELADALLQGRDGEVVPWKWATHRWPGWCDRILFLDIPTWVKRHYMGNNGDNDGGPSKSAPKIEIYAYNSLPTMRSSDHQPVFLRASVPLLAPGELLPDNYHTCIDDSTDPRFSLPVPIDTGAFARRATARKREVMTGMTALFFSTKEGAIVIAAVLGLGLWSWWLFQGLS